MTREYTRQSGVRLTEQADHIIRWEYQTEHLGLVRGRLQAQEGDALNPGYVWGWTIDENVPQRAPDPPVIQERHHSTPTQAVEELERYLRAADRANRPDNAPEARLKRDIDALFAGEADWSKW